MTAADPEEALVEEESGRRAHVLTAAMQTFARYGYRKTSMEDVARSAGVSRPGLYLSFASKQDLFRAAVLRTLDSDLAAADRALADASRPLAERLVSAFDHWTGRYIGAVAQEIAAVIDENPHLLEPEASDHPRRFAARVTDVLVASVPEDRRDVARDAARTLLSAARGIKQEARTREEFLERLTAGIGVLLLALGTGAPPRGASRPAD